LREARALTQVELAEQAGVSSRSVAGYEAGGGARPPTVRRLARALGVEIADLVQDASPKAPAPPPSPHGLPRREFLEHIKTLDREALAAISDELDEQLMRVRPSDPEYAEVAAKGLMVRMQMRIVDNPDARFEAAEAERKLAALAGAL
jgi:transcriptional regulator with XRE-family HTH domain